MMTQERHESTFLKIRHFREQTPFPQDQKASISRIKIGGKVFLPTTNGHFPHYSGLLNFD